MRVHVRSLILGLSLAIAFILGCVTASHIEPVTPAQAEPPGTSAKGPGWEYYCVAELNADQMNEVGRKGWELVTATAAGAGNKYGKDWAYQWCFKRPL